MWWLAAVRASSSTGLGLVPLYYIVTILGVLGGGAVGLYRWQKNQRQQWLDEGRHAQSQAEALTANTEAATRNTEAIGQLTSELRAFVAETRSQITEQANQILRHNARLDRLENKSRLGS